MIKIRGTEINAENLAKMIDHSVLHPDATQAMYEEGIQKCWKYKFNTFCCNPNYLEASVKDLKGSGVGPSVVIDFPFGAGTHTIKMAAAEDMVKKGAVCLDLVIDVGALKNGNYKLVTDEIRDVASLGAETKIIIEAALLTPEEVVAACKCVADGGGTYVKSSTGRHGGPEQNIVKLMRDSSPPHIKVKVAGTGSFWTAQIAFGCLVAGADVIGTRAGDKIIEALPLIEEMFYGPHVEIV